MKRTLIYFVFALALVFTGCQRENLPEDIGLKVNEDGKVTLTFSASALPLATISTKAGIDDAVNRIDLLVFTGKKNGVGGQFIEKVKATEVTYDPVSKAGTFKVVVSHNARIFHLFVNYDDIDNINERDILLKYENDIVPYLHVHGVDKLVYWGRIDLSTEGLPESGTIGSIPLYRNLAMVTVENNDADFDVLGFSLCNYATTSSVSPFDRTATGGNPFVWDISKPSIPESSSHTDSESAPNTDPKYTADYQNPAGDQLYVILRAKMREPDQPWGAEQFYKVLLSDKEWEPYPVVRNVNFIIKISAMKAHVGVDTYEQAKTAAPINDLTGVDVIPFSPKIDDMDNNSLSVLPQNHYIMTAGSAVDFESVVTVVRGGESLTDKEISVIEYNDPEDILSNVRFEGDVKGDSGLVKGTVANVDKLKAAEIRVKVGHLARKMTIVAFPQYNLTYYMTNSDGYKISKFRGVDTPVELHFNIDERIPSVEEYPDMYPITIMIRADNIYPVDDEGRQMLLTQSYKEGEIWYIYHAQSSGDHVLHFKTSMEKPVIYDMESAYFYDEGQKMLAVDDGSFSGTILKGAVLMAENDNESYALALAQNGGTVTLYNSNQYTTSVGTCKFVLKNGRYELEDNVTLNLPVGSTDVFFQYNYNKTYTIAGKTFTFAHSCRKGAIPESLVNATVDSPYTIDFTDYGSTTSQTLASVSKANLTLKETNGGDMGTNRNGVQFSFYFDEAGTDSWLNANFTRSGNTGNYTYNPTNNRITFTFTEDEVEDFLTRQYVYVRRTYNNVVYSGAVDFAKLVNNQSQTVIMSVPAISKVNTLKLDNGNVSSYTAAGNPTVQVFANSNYTGDPIATFQFSDNGGVYLNSSEISAATTAEILYFQYAGTGGNSYVIGGKTFTFGTIYRAQANVSDLQRATATNPYNIAFQAESGTITLTIGTNVTFRRSNGWSIGNSANAINFIFCTGTGGTGIQLATASIARSGSGNNYSYPVQSEINITLTESMAQTLSNMTSIYVYVSYRGDKYQGNLSLTDIVEGNTKTVNLETL